MTNSDFCFCLDVHIHYWCIASYDVSKYALNFLRTINIVRYSNEESYRCSFVTPRNSFQLQISTQLTLSSKWKFRCWTILYVPRFSIRISRHFPAGYGVSLAITTLRKHESRVSITNYTKWSLPSKLTYFLVNLQRPPMLISILWLSSCPLKFR